MNKNMKILIGVIILLVVFLVAVCFIWFSKKANGAKSNELYEATVTEVHQLNENSNFFGYKLLGDQPARVTTYMPTPLKDYDSADVFYTGQYHGDIKIIAMHLVSGDANVMGIAPGDNQEEIEEMLKETNFNKTESGIDNTIRYQAYHIIMDFEVGDDGRIKSIGISIADPDEVRAEY